MTKRISVNFENNVYHFEMERNATLKDLMEQIWERTNIPVKKQKYIFKGRKLGNENYQLDDKMELLLYVAKGPVNCPKRKHSPRYNVFSIDIEDNLDEEQHMKAIRLGCPNETYQSMENSKDFQLFVRKQDGNVVSLSFETNAIIYVESGKINRIFYDEIHHSGFVGIPNNSDFYALYLMTPKEIIWFYYIPQQYVDEISSLLQTNC